MEDREESEAAKLEVKISESKKKKERSPQTVARFRRKILSKLYREFEKFFS